MTNIEKFEKVFGFILDITNCLTEKCEDCPVTATCIGLDAPERASEWWNSEYKESEAKNGTDN